MDVQIQSDRNLAETIIPGQTVINIHPGDQIQNDTSGITHNSGIIQTDVQILSDSILAGRNQNSSK